MCVCVCGGGGGGVMIGMKGLWVAKTAELFHIRASTSFQILEGQFSSMPFLEVMTEKSHCSR